MRSEISSDSDQNIDEQIVGKEDAEISEVDSDDFDFEEDQNVSDDQEVEDVNDDKVKDGDDQEVEDDDDLDAFDFEESELDAGD